MSDYCVKISVKSDNHNLSSNSTDKVSEFDNRLLVIEQQARKHYLEKSHFRFLTTLLLTVRPFPSNIIISSQHNFRGKCKIHIFERAGKNPIDFLVFRFYGLVNMFVHLLFVSIK